MSRRRELEEVQLLLNSISAGNVLTAIARADRRRHDDVAAFAANVDALALQRTGTVRQRPFRVPLEQNVLPAARRNLRVRCRQLAMLSNKARPDHTTGRLVLRL